MSGGAPEQVGGPGRVAVCTVVAANYLAFARALARSLAAVHPGWKMHTLVLCASGAEREAVRADEPFEALFLPEIGLGPGDAEILPAVYDVTELATAVKPWVLETLLGREFDAVLYLDPDILVLGSLELLAETAASEGICLTPHCVGPMPRDGLRPDETDIYLAGIYNLGFIGVSAAARPMLAWWEERLRRECVSAPGEARFVDQRWMDAVPAMFRCGVRREKRFNAAYWNLQERPVEERGGVFYAGGEPLAFYHFSGFNPLQPWLLAKYLGPNPRHLLSEQPALRALAGRYAEMLLAEGFAEASRTPYPFNRTPSGVELTKGLRRRYLAEVVAAEKAGRPVPPSPFAAGGDGGFLQWLAEAGSDGRINAAAAAHADFRERGDTKDALEERGWDLFTERLMKQKQPGHLEQIAAAAERPPENAATREGYCIAGFLAGELGLGTAARAVVMAAERSGVPFSTYTYRNTESRQEHPFEDVRGGAAMDANIICVTADSLPSFHRRVGARFFEGRHNIGFWFWEVDKFPAAMRRAFDLVDEVWAATDYVAGALRRASDKPVLKFPMPVPVPEPEPGCGRAAFGLPEDRYLFLFTFDYLSVFERKNPAGLVAAFRSAFKDGEGPVLVIKSINGDKRRADRERLRYEAAGRSDIILIEDYMTAARAAALTAACDCYVSLHRAEGFGLGMAEAMLLGKPVIATGYSGNLEFMDADTARLVPFQLVPVGPGLAPYPSGAVWAEPEREAAAAAMKELASRPDAARELGWRGQAFAREKLDPRHGAAFLRERRAEISGLLRKKGESRAKQAARQSKGLPPDWRLPEETGEPRSPLGRLVERLTRREAQRRRAADKALAEAVRMLREDVRLVRDEVSRRLDAFEDSLSGHDE